MAPLAKFYGAALVESFDRLDAGTISALVHYKEAWEKARKDAAKGGKGKR